MKPKSSVKTSLILLPLTVAVTAAVTVGVLRIPWGSIGLPVTLGVPVIDLSSPPRAAAEDARPAALELGEPETPPPAGPAHDGAGPEPVILVAMESAPDEVAAPSPQPPSEPADGPETAASAPDNVPVDYARLQDNLKLVTDTLERFNQKLLRMIAQARAAQQQEEKAAARRREASVPEVEAPPASPPPDEEETLRQ